MLVTRLREVRALDGFTRLLPPGLGADVAPLPSTHRLAARDRGQGRGNLPRVRRESAAGWAKQSGVIAAGKLDRRSVREAGAPGAASPTGDHPAARAVHTFAHALIDQLALDAGYPAASLRERLYVVDDAAVS